MQSGSVALFAVTVKNGITEGTRRYLCSSNPEEALFGTAPDSIHQHHRLLAVPMGETELLKVDREYFEELVVDGDTRIVALVEGWLQQIDATLSHIATPAIQVRAVGEGRFSLIDGQILQPEPNAIAWVQIQQGNVRWMGFEELTLDASAEVFP